MSERRQDWYFTFGYAHRHPGCYTVIYGTFAEARAEMVRRHGREWAFQYSSAEEAGVERYGLRQVERMTNEEER